MLNCPASAPRINLRACVTLSAVAALLLFGTRRVEAATATDLAIRATATSFKVGVDGIYVITVTNNGGAATDDAVHVRDQLPNGLSFVSGIGAAWDCSASVGQAVDCVNTAPLVGGTTTTLRLTVSVCTDAFPSVTNTIVVAYAADLNGANNSTRRATSVKSGVCNAATPTRTLPPGTLPPTRTPTVTSIPSSTQTPVAVATDLLISATVNPFFTTGLNNTYFLTVTNAGAATTNAPITVTDVLPSGLSFVSATGNGWTCSVANQTVTCVSSDPLLSGGATTITLTVFASAAAFPTVTNIATLAYAGDTFAGNNTARRPTTVRRGAGVPGSPTATATTAPAVSTQTTTPTSSPTWTPTVGNATATDLQLGKTTIGTFRAGLHGLYFLTVINNGPGTTNAPITVTDFLPSGLSFVSATGTGWSCSDASDTVTCVYPAALAPTGSIGFSLEVAISNAAYPTTTNSAALTYTGDTDATNNTVRKATTVRAGRAVPGAQTQRPRHPSQSTP